MTEEPVKNCGDSSKTWAAKDRPVRPMNKTNARLTLEDLLRDQDWDFTVDITGDFANADLSNWMFKKWVCSANFSGNFAEATFAGAVLPGDVWPESREVSLEARVILSGNFQAADFRGATLMQMVLSGDFTGANFRGAKFVGCTMSGNFTRADLGATFDYCTTVPEARFDEAHLTNAFGLECNAAQVAGARTGPNSQILVPSGRNVQLGDTDYQVMQVHGFSGDVAECDFHRVRLSMLDSAHPQLFDRILELRACLKIEKELDFAGDMVGFDSR